MFLDTSGAKMYTGNLVILVSKTFLSVIKEITDDVFVCPRAKRWIIIIIDSAITHVESSPVLVRKLKRLSMR